MLKALCKIIVGTLVVLVILAALIFYFQPGWNTVLKEFKENLPEIELAVSKFKKMPFDSLVVINDTRISIGFRRDIGFDHYEYNLDDDELKTFLHGHGVTTDQFSQIVNGLIRADTHAITKIVKDVGGDAMPMIIIGFHSRGGLTCGWEFYTSTGEFSTDDLIRMVGGTEDDPDGPHFAAVHWVANQTCML